VGEEFESKLSRGVPIPMTKADLFLTIFEAIPGTLKPFRMWKNFENPLEMVRIFFENAL